MQVVKAVSQQLGTLNTNARYLHNNLVMHAEMLAATMPDPLEVSTFSPLGSLLLPMSAWPSIFQRAIG